jgi:hypothetical protein
VRNVIFFPVPAFCSHFCTPVYDWAKEHGHSKEEIGCLERIGARQDFHIDLTQMSNAEFIADVESKLTEPAAKQ